MSMLQTSLGTEDGTRRFNVPHTTIMWLRHRLKDIGTTLKHPHGEPPPGTALSQDWHIRLKHPWDQWGPPTRTVAETSGRHNTWISTQIMRNDLRRFTLRARRPYWGPILNRQRCAGRFDSTPFLSQSTTYRTSLDQMQSIHTLPW